MQPTHDVLFGYLIFYTFTFASHFIMKEKRPLYPLHMSLIICVNKASIDKTPDFHWHVLKLCNDVIEKDDFLIYVPTGGKLVEVIKLLTQHEIGFQLKRMLEIDPKE